MKPNGAGHVPILTYHGILPSPAEQPPAAWSRRHAVDQYSFAGQMDEIAARGMRTLRLAALQQAHLRQAVVITFDDGHSSDYLVAAPQLNRRGLTATFFITASFLGRPGYLRREQVRELHEWSFEIGSHGLTHKRLTEVGPVELWREALDSRHRIEDLIGAEVSSFALPSGAYDDGVLQALWAAGYRRIMTSDFGYARREHSVMHRMSVTAATTPVQFRAFLSAGPAWAACQRLIQGLRGRLLRIALRPACARGAAA